MTTYDELRDTVIEALWNAWGSREYDLDEHYRRTYGELADAAIAAVIDALAQEAEEYSGQIVWRFETEDFSPTDMPLDDWLRSRLSNPP